MQRLTAKDLQRRYRAGERNFARVDLSGESLRGINLKGIDLSEADLSRTDICGTNFSKANLISTQFVAAKAGTRHCWLVPQLMFALVLSALAGFMTAGLWIAFALSILNLSGKVTGSVAGDIVYGMTGITISLSFLWLIYARGASTALSIALGAFAGAVAIAYAVIITAAIAFVDADAVVSNGVNFAISAVVSGIAVTFSGSIAFSSTVAFADTSTIAIVFAGVGAGASIVVGLGAGAITVAFAGVGTGYEYIAIAIAIVGMLINSLVNFRIARRALEGDARDSLLRTIAVWFSSWGGTKFVYANLTDASFEHALLKSTKFYKANLSRTKFHLAKQINLSRLGRTILTNFNVQNLLIILRGSGQSYSGLNLKGAYLAGADLADADFTEADISQATLEGATLERANLTKTQALGTNFHQTILTGATLEAWNIDSTTNLDGAICDYIYLLRNQQERRPSSGNFAPGEFAKLFQEVLDTIDLIFQNGVDWKAFVRTFNDVQELHDNADLGVQAIENKGDGVVVVKLHATSDADKPAIHQSFTEIYQLALQEAEARYKAQLDAKDDQIADYRQQSANMQEVVKLLAQRPINVDVKAIAESKAMQGNDNSQKISMGDNATGNVFQAGGQGNTASIEFQQVTLPPPDRVNIQAELAALQAILAEFNRPVIDVVVGELLEEATKPAPDKSAIATTLETGLTYARNLQGFAEAIDKLRPHVQNAAGWLGEHGTKLLPLVGLML